MKKSKDSLRDHQEDQLIYIMGVPKGWEGEKGAESLLQEIMAENFPNLGKQIDIQIQDT